MISKSFQSALRGTLWAAGGSLVTLSVVYSDAIASYSLSVVESVAYAIAEYQPEQHSTKKIESLEIGDKVTETSLTPTLNKAIETTPIPSTQLAHEEAQAETVSAAALTTESGPRNANGFASSKEKADFIGDYDDRIPQDFKVPADFKDRVGFWFDIYTKYGSDSYVLHHSEYPWIVFRVVDVSEIMAIKTKNPWAPHHKSKAFIKKEKARLISQLARIQHGKLKAGRTREEKELVAFVKNLPSYVSRKGLHLELREQRGQRDFFMSGLISSSKYLHQMEEIFAKANLPIELTRIPLVESSFNTKAVSKVGASGIWQFMPGIGSKFMHVSNHIDERNSPLKATEAAARLLRQNWLIFKAWPLAITAYNHGAGNLLKAVQKLKTKDFSVIVRKNNHSAFGVASSNFYSSFLAALHAERYQHEIFGDIAKSEPLLSDIVRLNFRVRTRRVADFTGMTFEEIRLFNPDLKKNVLSENHYLPKGYRLHVPAGKAQQIELLELEAKNEPSPSNKTARRKRTQVFEPARTKKSKKLVTIDFTSRTQVVDSESDSGNKDTSQE